MTDVSQETISLNSNRNRGMGVDWTHDEIAVVMSGLSPRQLMLALPHRSRRAIYLKRHRLGIAQKYHRSKR